MSEKKYRKMICTALVLGLLLSFASGMSTDAACPKLNRTNVTLTKGECCTLKVKSKNNCSVTWCSNKKNVASVNRSGKITAKNEGKAKITAKTCGKKLKCTVNVCNPCSEQDKCPGTQTSEVYKIIMFPGQIIQTPAATPVPAAIPATEPTATPAIEPTAIPSIVPTTTPAITPTAVPSTDPSGVTEESAYQILNSFRNTYPEGMPLNNSYYYYSKVFGHGYGCYGFAAMLSDTVFGTTKAYSTHSNFADIKVGDNIRIGNRHSVICLTKGADYITVVEGNYNSSVHWDRKITRTSLNSEGFKVYTRY